MCCTIVTVVLTMGLCGCEKELDFKYHEIEPIPVIEGNLSQDGAEVKITYTTPVDLPLDTEGVTDAMVVIDDLTDKREQILTVGEDGVFRSIAGGIPGHDYRLRVKMGDKNYVCDSPMYQPVMLLDFGFNWVHVPIGDMAVARVVFLDDPTDDVECYVVKLYRNDEVYAINTISTIQAVNNVLVQLIPTTQRGNDGTVNEDGSEILRGDKVTVTVQPITRRYYDYLVSIGQGSNGNNLFTGDYCLGYFLAAPITTATLTFNPDDYPYYDY